MKNKYFFHKRFENMLIVEINKKNLRICKMYVCDYLNWIDDIQDKTPCIALTPFKHENGRVD